MTTATCPSCLQADGEILFHRTVQVRPYEVAKSEIRLAFKYDPDANAEGILTQTEQIDTAAKAYVYGALGLDTTVEDGKLVEVFTSQLPGSKIIDIQARADSAQAEIERIEEDSAANPPHDPAKLSKKRNEMSEVEKAMDKENRTWAEARLKTHPNEFHDNRAEKNAPGANPKWPDFKHKTHGIAVWADD